MNEVLIPPPPNWYQCSILECAPDNTVVYGSKSDLIIIYPRDSPEPAHIERIFRTHTEKITSISLNHVSWGDPDKLAASIGADKVVRLWDINELSLKMQHKEHEKNKEPLVGVSLVKDRVVSVSEKGVIVIWRLSTNTATKLTDIFSQNVKVKCMSSCPHATWLTAFGLSGGLTVVADLRNGKVLHKMRGNDSDVIGLSWCPIPINIYRTEVGIVINNIIKNKITRKTVDETVENKENYAAVTQSNVNTPKNIKTKEDKCDDTEIVEDKLGEISITEEKDDILDVDIPKYNMDERTPQVYKRVNKNNPWGDVKFNDSDTEVSQEDYKELTKNDFLEDCNDLRNILENTDVIPAGSSLKNKHSKSNYKTKLMFEKESRKTDTIEKHETANLLENVQQINDSFADNADTTIEIPEKEVSTETFISETSNKEYLLATIGKNGHLHIWRALTDGRLELFLIVPVKQMKKGRESFRYNFVAVCWVKPDILVCSTCTNRVYSWNLLPDFPPDEPPSKQDLLEPRLVHQDHSGPIFTIHAPYKIYSALERTLSWSSLKDLFVWTTSRDKWILCTTLGTERKTLVSYPCLSSGVKCMAVSPIDPTKLAIGLYDCTIRIWDLSLPQTQAITMSKLVDPIQDNIYAMDWHPVKENWLAYGTSEGKIAHFELNNKTRIVYHPYHGNIVFKIQWGPFPEKEGEFALYSCSMGSLIYHDGTDPSAEPNKIDVGEGRAQTFAWNSDYSILAVGTKEGSVKLLSKNFEVYETLYMQRKAVQCIVWHPESTVADCGRSPYADYMAVSTNDSNILVYNCRRFEEKDSTTRNSIVAMLEGHNNSIKWLSWCPQIGGRLVSGSEDSIVMVWNVISQTLLSTFKWEQRDDLGYLIWSPIDADLIILGGKDQTIKIFRITKYPPVVCEPEKKDKKKSNPKPVHENDDNESILSVPLEKTKKLLILPCISKLQNPECGENINTCKKLLKLCDEDCEGSEDETSAQTENESPSNLKIDATQLFSSQKNMINMLKYEQEQHDNKKSWKHLHYVSLWRGDLANSIEKALQSGEIDPWIINMAPMVSHTLWSKLCLKYAEKLSEEGNGLEASSYFLACHQVQKAVDALCKSNLYREALAVAKCRLPADDPLIDSIYDKWASYCICVGNFEVAVQCYIKLGRFSEAGILLNKRAEPEKLELALELAQRSKNHDLEVAVKAKLELLSQQKEQVSNSVSETSDNELKYPIIKICQSRFEAMMISNENKNGDDVDSTENVSINDVEENKDESLVVTSTAL